MRKWIGLGLSCLLLAGCWDERQVKQRNIIFGAAIDAPSKQDITFTVDVPEAGSEQMPASTKQVVSAKEKTVREGAREISRKLGNRMEVGKIRVLLISKESVQHDDIYRLLDAFYRNATSPLNAHIILTEGKAESFFRNELEGEPLYSTYYHNLIESAENLTIVPRTNLQQFASPLFDEAEEDTMAPLLTFNEEKKLAEVKGTALFNGQRMSGELSTAETTILLLMKDDMGKDASLTFPVEKEQSISFRIEKMKRKMNLHIPKDGPASVDLSYEFQYRVTDYPPGHLEVQKNVKKLDKKISEEIKQSMEKTMDKIKEAESDVLGIGLRINAKDPERFKQLKWETAYPEVEVNIQVKAEIIESGITF